MIYSLGKHIESIFKEIWVVVIWLEGTLRLDLWNFVLFGEIIDYGHPLVKTTNSQLQVAFELIKVF